ncbi:integrase, catalytic region, zinc finger, CCHC-type containing protein [Tanacetum coccineum]|uniref:Integrase, catalytic region, zinc finger, CCHC-type containing protein n=1 Tax=Tanacetum coccineum TaxID=301880 RepID=A0ABQ5DGB0_9ASTR
MSTQQDIYATGSENRPPMLNKDNYVPWSSRLLRYARSKPNGKLLVNSIKNGPYVKRMIHEPSDPNGTPHVAESTHEQTDDELTDKEMMRGSTIGAQEKTAKLFNEWEKFKSTDGELIKSYYHRFSKLMNDFSKEKHFPEKIASNLKFLNNLQHEWKRYVTTEEVNEVRAERLARTHDPLALMENSQNPYNYPVFHPDHPSQITYMQHPSPNNNYVLEPPFNTIFVQQPIQNPDEIINPTTAMNMALVLMAKSFKLNYYTPINNNMRISSNPRKRQIAQPGMNMGQDRQMQMVEGNGGNQFRYAECRESGIANQNANQNGNGNVVAAQAKGNGNGNPGDIDEIEEVNAIYGSAEVHHYENCYDNEIFNMFNQEEQYTELLEPITEPYPVQQNNSNVIPVESSMEHNGGSIEQHPTIVEEIHAYFESLYNNLVTEVEKVNTVNRKMKETNSDLTTELVRYKGQEKCFEFNQEKFYELENGYRDSCWKHEKCRSLPKLFLVFFNSVYQEQCLTKKINALHLSSAKQITTLNEEIANLNNQFSKEKSVVSYLHQEREKLKSDFKTCEDELLDKLIQYEKKIKEIYNILVKTGQSIQTMHILSPKLDSFYHTEQKMALGYQNPFYLKQAQQIRQSLYNGRVLLENHDPPAVYDSKETLKFAQVSQADESLDKITVLEKENERLLRAVVNQDIMSIVQRPSVVETSDLQTELERTKERFENCIIKNENEYTKLWNDRYKKCEECKYEKISYDKAYNNMKHQIERLQAQLGDINGTSANIKFAKPSILGKSPSTSGTKLYSVTPFPKTRFLLKVVEKHDLTKPVTLHLVPKTQESKVMKNKKVIALAMFKINPTMNSMVDKFVPNKHVKASVRTNLIIVSQSHIITKKYVNSDSNGLSFTGVDNTAKTRRPHPRSNTKNDMVPSMSKSSCIKNNKVEVEEHHRNLLLSKNQKHMSSECNNVKLASRNDISEVVCSMCKQCLITANHDVCVINYVNDMNSRADNQNAKVSNTTNQKKHKAKVKKSKKLPQVIQICLWYVNSGCSKHMTGNLKLLIKFVWKFMGTVRFGNDNIAAILDLEVAFRRNTCFVRNLEGVDLLKGNCTTKLYIINLHEMASASPICLIARATSTKSWLWHQRLSHLNFDTINDLAKNNLVSGAKAIATACYTQNRSLIHQRFDKTPYELINGRKPNISFLHVFGALSYPKNDREDIWKLGAKGDICFFIGYSTNFCAYRVYNRRTKKIMETMNVTFDKLSSMAFKQRSSKPEHQGMTTRHISSGLAHTYVPLTITSQKLTERELDILFESMYDDYIDGQPPVALRTAPAGPVNQNLQTPNAFTTVEESAPTPTTSSSQSPNFPNTS